MAANRPSFRNSMPVLLGVFTLLGLYLSSLYSYLLFHTLVEMYSIVIAGAIFVLAWNFRRFYKNSFLIFIGSAYAFCSFIDLLHTLSFKGMGIFTGYDTNLPTQLWIAARYLQSISLLVAPVFLKRKIKIEWVLSAFALITSLLLLSIFTWKIFPVCYVEGVGLTPFKIASEYIIDLILVTTLLVLWYRRRSIDQKVLKWMMLSIGLTILTELAFTFYVDVYGISNLFGHFCKIIAYYLVYKAVIETEAGSIYTDMTQLRETEEALRASELQAQSSLAELRTIYAHTPVGLGFFDTSLHCQAINDMLASMNGRSVSESIGKTPPELLPADLAAPVEQSLRRVLETGQPVLNQELSGQIDATSSQKRQWLASFHPIFVTEGVMLGVNCVMQDVTEQRLAEQAMETSERNLRLFIEYAPASIAMLDKEMRYIATSRRYLADYHLKGQDIIGHSHYEIFPEISEEWKEIHRRCLAGASEQREVDAFPRADGSLDWVHWEIHPWYDHHGAIGGIILFSELITERLEAENALRESEKRFRSVVESNMIGVVFSDQNSGQVIDANDEYLRIVGRTRQELAAGEVNWRAMTPPELLDQEERANAGQPRGQRRSPYEKEYLRPDGTRVPVIIGGSFLDEDSQLLVAFVLDNTERKRTENELSEAHQAMRDYAERLQRSNQELEDFAFVASHDLQEPLRKIKMFGNRLLNQIGELPSAEVPQGARDSLGRMQNATERMQVMIDRLLELSRVNTRGGNFVPVELKPLVEEVVNDLEASLQASGGQVRVEELYSAELDVAQIRRLFQNLIGNALKFHREGVPPLVKICGSIERSLTGSTVTISIQDNGIGFDEQYAERIFQPFQRLHGRNEYDGSGLGLSICKRIVERHHGKIEAHSQPDKGSLFLITLPVHQPRE